MLSVINRGSITGSESEGLPYKVISGYRTHEQVTKLNNIPSPLPVNIDPVIKIGYLTYEQSQTLESINVYPVNIVPIVKSGYTPIEITPTEG